MITISGKNFSFQASQIKVGTSITISSSGEIKFNNVALEAKMQSANKSDLHQSKNSFNFGHSKNDQPRSEPAAQKPEVTRGKPFPSGGQPPRVVDQLPNTPEVIKLMPAEEIILGDALEPPNGEFQVLSSKLEPRNSLPRDFVRTPSLDDTKFIETDLSRKLAAEEAGGFDEDLISLTGIQPEVASEPKFPTVISEVGEPLFEIPEQIVLGDALPPPPGGFQVLGSNPTPEFIPAEEIILGDALPPPPGGFQVLGSNPTPEFIPAEEIILGDALPPPPGGFQVLGSNPTPEFIPAEEIIRGDALEPLNQVLNVGPTITPSEDVIRNDALEPLNQSFDLKPAEEAKSSIFNFVVSNK